MCSGNGGMSATRARGLQRAAERGGVSGAMYLWGECLLEGIGAPADTKQAFRWFAAAGELGHRGARQRITRTLVRAFSAPERGQRGSETSQCRSSARRRPGAQSGRAAQRTLSEPPKAKSKVWTPTVSISCITISPNATSLVIIRPPVGLSDLQSCRFRAAEDAPTPFAELS